LSGYLFEREGGLAEFMATAKTRLLESISQLILNAAMICRLPLMKVLDSGHIVKSEWNSS
jgi:hypothetical protein